MTAIRAVTPADPVRPAAKPAALRALARLRTPGANLSDREFLAPALEILETPPSPVHVAFLWTICAFVLAALVWAYLGRVDIVAAAQGKFQPTGRVKVVEPLETGRVEDIRVANGSLVKAGDVLIELDRASAEADVERAALEYDRSYKLAQTNFGSQQHLEQATADRDRTVAALAAARASVASTAAALDGSKANLDVLKAQKDEAAHQRTELVTALAMAERNLSFTRVFAAFDGTVGNVAAHVGELVQPGTRLMALVPLNDSYVDANFKETQLGDIKPGQKVDVAIDALDGKVVEGVVSSISPASGSEFSLLPPDNATGNFTKVVQRVAVRITFPEDVLKEVPLRPGLSVVATVHTRDPDAPKPTLLGALGLEAFATRSVKP